MEPYKELLVLQGFAQLSIQCAGHPGEDDFSLVLPQAAEALAHN